MNKNPNGRLRTLALASCALAALSTAVRAQPVTSTYDIPPGDLKQALKSFAKQSNVNVLFTSAEVAQKGTPGFHGQATAPAVLDNLLLGTGLRAASGNNALVVLADGRQEAPVQGPPGLGATAPANAPAPADDNSKAVSEVVVTGSLIHHIQPVGVTVETFSAKDYAKTGALTTADLLRTLPAIHINEDFIGGGNGIRGQFLDIHRLGSVETLMLVDGMRPAPQNTDVSFFDPSVIPSIAIGHVDVLADGASATYGADAVAGVVNLNMRRGYEGALSQARYSFEDGAAQWQVAQLVGHRWSSGDLTVGYEHYDKGLLPGAARSSYNYDFSTYGVGLPNLDPLSGVSPGIVFFPGTSAPGFPSIATRTCSNCLNIPKGQNGTGLIFSALTPSPTASNRFNPYQYGQITPRQVRDALTFTFDQDVTSKIHFFAEGYYSARNATSYITPTGFPASNTGGRYTVTQASGNPYYPIGAPSSLAVEYNFAPELRPLQYGFEHNAMVIGGLNVDLPMSWTGKLTYAWNNTYAAVHNRNLVNANNANAALGNTVNATDFSVPGVQTPVTVTRPASVPYLNLFCDPSAYTCNSQTTLNYISAYYDYHTVFKRNEVSSNFDGPLFNLPGGTVRAAVGGEYFNDNFIYIRNRTDTSATNTIVTSVSDPQTRSVWAAYGQIDIPIVGSDNSILLIRKLEAEVAVRHDNYSDFGGTTNPKFALNWVPFEGLKLRGSWGTSFRAPTFADLSPVVGRSVQLALGNSGPPTCPGGIVGGTPVPGSAGAVLNPTCSAALMYPTGIAISGGGGGLAGLTRPAGSTLTPETSKNLTLGFDFTPRQIPGFSANITYFDVNISNAISAYPGGSNALTDPTQAAGIVVNPSASVVSTLFAAPGSTIPTGTAPSSVTYLADQGSINLGSLHMKGVDFSFAYERDLGSWGHWNLGANGTDTLNLFEQNGPGTPTADVVGTTLGNLGLIRWRARGTIGWSNDLGLSIDSFINYQGSFNNRNAVAIPLVAPSFTTIDLAVTYDTATRFQNPYLRNISIALSISDITDRLPPFFYNSATGNSFNPAGYSPIGRVTSLTISKKW